VQLKVQSLDELSDDQLMRKLAVLTEMAKPLLAKLSSIDVQAVDMTQLEPQRNPEQGNGT